MVGLFRRRRASAATRNRGPTSVSIDDIVPHLRSTLYITGAFCTAWSWDLVFYGASHVSAGENPLQDQLSFGNQRAPKHFFDLLLQYLVVCGGAAVLSHYLRSRRDSSWCQAAVTAVEFFPSPVFAGKLMAYLGQFARLGTVKRAVINLAATWFAASLAHVMPMLFGPQQEEILEGLRLTHFGEIVQATLGFGLGIAWNVFLGEFGPQDRSDLDVVHLIGLGCYLACVSLIAFRLAAVVKEDVVTLWDRQLALLSFAFYVVCAFTLVTFLNALLHPGWLGALESFAVLLVLSAAMSAVVARVSSQGSDAIEEETEQTNTKLELLHGPCGILLFLPCVWFCCPWIPLMWVLAGTSETLLVKEHWFQLIAMVAGLAASIDASGMLTTATDAIAGNLGICSMSKCHHPWLFVLLQIVLATLTTAVVLPLIAPLARPNSDSQQSESSDDDNASTERVPLLRRIRRTFSRRSSSSKLVKDAASFATSSRA